MCGGGGGGGGAGRWQGGLMVCVCLMTEEKVTPFIHEKNTNKIKNYENSLIHSNMKNIKRHILVLCDTKPN